MRSLFDGHYSSGCVQTCMSHIQHPLCLLYLELHFLLHKLQNSGKVVQTRAMWKSKRVSKNRGRSSVLVT